MRRVFVTRRLPGAAVAFLQRSFQVDLWEEAGPPPYPVLCERVRACDGVLTLLTDRIDDALLTQAPSLKVVSNMAVGFDNIDVPACTRRGVLVGNTPGVLTETSADFAWALFMAAARRVVEAEAFLRAGKWTTWDPSLLLGRDVHGATLGLAGMGKIGEAVARRARGFGMRLLYCSRTRKLPLEQELGLTWTSWEGLFSQADFLSLHLPLSEATRGFVDQRLLSMMKPTSILINTARGAVVDQKALVEALGRGRPAFAALDVMEVEPLPLGDPLLTLPNVLLAPHIASATVATRERMAQMAADNLAAALEGRRPPHCVNPEVLG